MGDAIEDDDNDEAARYGPLTKHELEKYRKEYDPRCPVRPLRVLPTGRPVGDNEQSKAFRKFAYEHDLPIQLVNNPKERGSESYKRYQRYQLAKTLKQIVELSATAKSLVTRQQQKTKARADIVNDFLRGYILFPTAENRSATHFVNAAELASKHKTQNIHSLYSRRELREARVKESKKAEARTAALFAAYEEKGYVTFNEELEFMWDKDPPPTILNGDGGALHERACAVAFSALVDGDAP